MHVAAGAVWLMCQTNCDISTYAKSPVHASLHPYVSCPGNSDMFGLPVAHRRPCCGACAAAFQQLVLLVQTLIYPQLYRYILHPCVSWPDNPDMCGGLHTATGDLRFDSFLTQDDVVIMLIYEVSALPSCLSAS